LHWFDLVEQAVVQSDRFGSMLKNRALHSATHGSVCVSHAAALTQAAQPLAD
jgi:hypothetical protein